MTAYRLTEDPALIERTADGMTIRAGTLLWSEYIGWLEAGGAPAAFVPEFARSGDFFHAMIDLGWYDDIDAVIAGMVAANHPQAKLAKVLWDKASRYERNNPLLVSVATAAGKTSDDLDALFRKTLEYE